MKVFRILIVASLAILSGCAAAPKPHAATTSQVRPSRPMETLRVPRVRFIAAQNGAFEKVVKAKLSVVLKQHPEIKRAYLVSALYPNSTIHVVLGLVSTSGPSLAVVSDVQTAFASIASSNAALDIMFLSQAEQAQVAALAKPFYVGP